jgi:hypothetical protein
LVFIKKNKIFIFKKNYDWLILKFFIFKKKFWAILKNFYYILI